MPRNVMREVLREQSKREASKGEASMGDALMREALEGGSIRRETPEGIQDIQIRHYMTEHVVSDL